MPLSSDQHIIDRQFKSELENYSVRPYGRVWTRIAQSLNLKARKSEAKKILTITAGLLLIGSSAGVYETLHHGKNQQEQDNMQLKRESVTVVKDMPPVTTGKDNNQVLLASHTVSPYPPSQEKAVIRFEPSDESFATEFTRENVSLNAMDAAKRTTLDRESRESAAQKRLNNYSPAIPGNCFVGITANFNNTWLLDKHAMSSDNMKYELTFGASYGLQGGWHFSERWGVQTAWILNSWQGQHYKNLDVYGRTTNLDFREKSISLTYMNVPLLVQYRIPGYSYALNGAYDLSLILGGQYGRLLSYRVDGVKGEITDNDLFTHNEFAVVTGFDYDLMTDNPVFYTVGIRASLGTNIFNEEVPNYFEFSKPHNFIIGLHGAVNFGFSK